LGERANFRVGWRAQGDPVALPPETRREVILVLAEALANVERHADATLVDMMLVWEPHCMRLTMTDDGRGFDAGSVSADGGMGLWVMRQRAQEIGGQLELASSGGRGTTITLMVPIERPAQP
jgi:signal transduction histidine kinase